MEISKLPFRHITPKEKEDLAKRFVAYNCQIVTNRYRGKKFRQIGVGAHHQHLTGHMYRSGWWNRYEIKAEGRVMIDPRGGRKMGADYHGKPCKKELSELTEELLWMTWPEVFGFSFTMKQVFLPYFFFFPVLIIL